MGHRVRDVRDALERSHAARHDALLTKNLKVSEKIAECTLPVGTTMNMDGTALYEGVAILSLIQIYGGLDDVSITLGGVGGLSIPPAPRRGRRRRDHAGGRRWDLAAPESPRSGRSARPGAAS